MSYTKKDFALRLKRQLIGTYDIVKVARWAHQEFLDHARELEVGLQLEMMKVIAMEEGSEFEMTEPEIRKFADELEKS